MKTGYKHSGRNVKSCKNPGIYGVTTRYRVFCRNKDLEDDKECVSYEYEYLWSTELLG